MDVELQRLTADAAPTLCQLKGVGPEVAGALLVAAGDNPERLRLEAALASLCGSLPSPPRPARPSGTGSTGAATGSPTTPSGGSS